MDTLSILKLEYLLRMREKGTLVHKTKNGKIIPVKNMTDKHLTNAINYFENLNIIREHIEDISSIW